MIISQSKSTSVAVIYPHHDNPDLASRASSGIDDVLALFATYHP
jgi:hypothetical protein